MKKITSMFMAVAMILALAVPALAASTSSASIMGSTSSGTTVAPETPYQSDFKGEYQQTVINVGLPNNVALVFNPYRLQYQASTNHTGDDNAYLVDQLADQIFSAPVKIVSKSNIALKVDMKFNVEQTGDLELVDDVSSFDKESKKAVLQMEYGIVTNADDTPDNSEDKKVVTLTAGEDTALTSLLEDPDEAAALMLEIPPCVDADHPSYFCYKFTGEAETNTGTEEPKPYGEQDGINVGITFTFLPVANAANQVQGGTFSYISTKANDDEEDTEATAIAHTDCANVAFKIPEAQQNKLTAITSGSWTLSDVTVNNLAIADNDVVNYITLATDAKTVTLTKKAVWGTRAAFAGVTAGTKYVKVIPVVFTAKAGSGNDQQEATITCNVRIIYNPIKAAS